MYKIRAFTKVMLVTSAVVVNAAVFAIVGMPWAIADPPIDTGGGSSGGGGPPGGIADAPEGASGSDGLWSATVGGIEHAGLGAGDVGRTLWRGSKVERTILGDNGIPRTVQVCGGFPEIVLETSQPSTAPGGGAATVNLDLVNCTVALSELTRTNTGALGSPDTHRGGPQTLAWYGDIPAGFVPVAWLGSTDVAGASPLAPSNDRPTWRETLLGMRLKALDGLGIRLTKTEIRRRYSLGSRETISFWKGCDANSPAFLRGVFWREDACSGGHSKSLDRARAWAQGRFHGEITSGARFNGSTHHNLNVLLIGSATRDVGRCTVNPTSIEDLTVTVARIVGLRITLGVAVTCEYTSDTG